MSDDPMMQAAPASCKTEDERWLDNVRHMVEGVLGMPPNQAAKVVAVAYTLLPLSARERVEYFLSTPPKSQMGLLEDLVKAARSFVNQNDVGMKNAGGWLEHALELVEEKLKAPDAPKGTLEIPNPQPAPISKGHLALAQAAQAYLELISQAEVTSTLKDVPGVRRRGQLREAYTKLNALVGAALGRQ